MLLRSLGGSDPGGVEDQTAEEAEMQEEKAETLEPKAEKQTCDDESDQESSGSHDGSAVAASAVAIEE